MSSNHNFMYSKFMQTWLYFFPRNDALTAIRAFSSHFLKQEILYLRFQNLSLHFHKCYLCPIIPNVLEIQLPPLCLNNFVAAMEGVGFYSKHLFWF